ncbi:glycosyltransferase family 2 protein [Streptomyces triticiradicis]|uniref:Glycosyltransferase family 2 protein n=1 Tax=Streptomyces triticiradicis TaxID=2651189 RepID=A0A7J5D7K1_9ACTN|nr:glycosyltransferase family 2 protein [Streptomyces triticiradicis]KAB1980777.1 glycosyltransferase family 2 protein [Streptomyces triticiradicis]
MSMYNDPIIGSEQEADTHGTVSLVDPALNEARNIAWIFEQIPACVDEVILVDGGSTDATVPMAQHCLPTVHNVRQSGPGKGNALRTGPLDAKGDYVVMTDADGSTSPAEIPHFVHFLDHGYCAFRRSFLGQLDLHAAGFEIEAEMIVHAPRSGPRVAEVPSLELPRRSDCSNLHAMSDGRRVLRTLLSERPVTRSSAARPATSAS